MALGIDNADMKEAMEMREERKAVGISEGQLAFLLGMPRWQYVCYERGEELCPSNTRQQIRVILDKIKAGEVKIPDLGGVIR
jgi:predicted transcriptional regulator